MARCLAGKLKTGAGKVGRRHCNVRNGLSGGSAQFVEGQFVKGGSFLVLLFLLACFLWGVGSIVGGIRSGLSSRLAQKSSSRMPAESIGSAEMSGHSSPVSNDALDRGLLRLREASQLYQSGVLTDHEFSSVKARLLKDIGL